MDFKDRSFRTVLKPESFDFNIDYKSKLLFIGSCFTENIGKKLEELKFNIKINPFGILYNPFSVSKALNFILDNKSFEENDLFYYNEKWNSYYHHGFFSGVDKSATLKNINDQIDASSKFIKETDFLFITFGTAWAYQLIENEQIVSNCHKVPNKNFNKLILRSEEIYKLYFNLIEKIRSVNDKMEIIFTISPVRHLKDGFIENFLSKSILRVSIDRIISQTNNTYYFPSYELLIDDLRDYRFYEKDMLHPSDEAIDYIFERYRFAFFNSETNQILDRISKLLKSINHRPFNKGTKQYESFIKSVSETITGIEKDYAYIDLSKERTLFP